MTSTGVRYAALAGVSAALASVFGKLAMTSLSTVLSDSSLDIKNHLPTILTIETLELVIRVFCFAMIFVMNSIMWSFFVKSLNLASNTVSATVINSSTNYFCSALFGFLLFREHLEESWWFGASLILIGLFLINKGNEVPKLSQKQD
mmetsp:Transcript_28010/g.39482  ORF Transcript_28010/g.39482 Transcript_28010/m.39482 type:complete len:147 (-) Transcript_28010:68-508(-)